MQAAISRVFMNGNSQAVRIPQKYRLNADSVRITRTAAGDLLLRPVPSKPIARGQAVMEILGATDSQWIAALEADRATQLPAQQRETF